MGVMITPFPAQIDVVIGAPLDGVGSFSENDVVTLTKVTESSTVVRYTESGVNEAPSGSNRLVLNLKNSGMSHEYWNGASSNTLGTISGNFTGVNTDYDFGDIAPSTVGGSKYQGFSLTSYDGFVGGATVMFGSTPGGIFKSLAVSSTASASESPSESASESASESGSVSPSESSSLSPSASESPSSSPSESASESASESPSPESTLEPVQIKTLLNKVHRVSRPIVAAGITATVGLWVELTDGKLQDITTNTPGSMNKFPFDPGSNNIYESHDKIIGRFTTIETEGVRIQVNIKGYVPGMTKGDDLVVSVEAGQEGKLKKAANAAPGTYEVVARCEEIDNVNEIMTWSLCSPRYVTIS